MGMTGGTWLCPDPLDRERLLDMGRRLATARLAVFLLIAYGLAVSSPWTGVWILLPLGLAALGYRLAEWRIERRARPEYWVAAAWVFSQLMIGVAVALTGASDSPVLMWLAIPVVALPARFNTRGMVAGVAITAAVMAVVTVGLDPAVVTRRADVVVAPAILLLAVAILSSTLMRSDVDHRQDAVLDPLTGLLNRAALERRFAELAQQARLTGEWVGVVVADLDHFKDVNDRLGHARGDAVLREVADAMRGAMRAFDLIYRLGGEEFLLLLPGADVEQSRSVAERMRAAVAAARPGGLELSMSLGVAAGRGEAVRCEALYHAADEALYEAKQAGRDRVCAGAGLLLSA